MAASQARSSRSLASMPGIVPEVCAGTIVLAGAAGVATGAGAGHGLLAAIGGAGLGTLLWQRRRRTRELVKRLERQVGERTAALQAVVLGAATEVGDDFFRRLVEHLAMALDARYVCVCEIQGDEPARVRAFAVWDDGQGEPTEYELAGTPCRDVVERGETLCVNGDLVERYPDDPWLAPLKAVAYCGAPIRGRDGAVMGIVSVIGARRFDSERMARSLVSIFAQRAGAEMERTWMIAQITESSERWRRSEQMLRIAGRVARVGGWELDVASMRLAWTDEVYRICEISPSSPPDLTYGLGLHPPEARPLLEAAVKRGVEHGEGWDIEVPLITGSGARRWVRTIGAVEQQDGRAVRLYGSLQDITDRKLAELERDQLFDNSLGLLCTAGFDGRFKRVNPAWTRALEYSREELLSRPFLDFVHPEDREATIAATAALSRGEPVLDFENRYLTRSGEVRRLLWSAVPDVDRETIYASAYDVTEKRGADEELRIRELRLRMAMEAAGEGLWDWDLSTGRTYYSDSWYTMLGFEPGELEMCITSWEELVHPDDVARAWAELEKHFRGEAQRYVSEQRLRTKSGDWKWILDVGEVVERGADGKPLRAVGVHIDIDEQKRAQAELASAREAAEAASQAKTEFLANMSHEIRTPMTAILGYADLLAAPDQPPAQRAECAAIIRRNGEHLLNILSDILDVSRIEAGMLRIDAVEFSPVRLIEDVCQLLEAPAAAKGLRLHRRWQTPLPATIGADPGRLRQILNNLIGNAVKFTERGEVTVTTSLDGGALRVCVQDTGIGIDPKQIEGLFEPFSQADPSVTRRFGGAGLGLTISRNLARILGGEIAARSEPGAGSAFTLTLPVPAGAPQLTTGIEVQQAIRPPELAGPSGASVEPGARELSRLGARILVAEDGADNQRLIRHHLQAAGARVEVAENGRLAVDAALGASAADDPFDLILMDMQMPVMDGYTAAAELRRRGYTAPVVALTAHATPGDRERCVRAGCDDYLAKPVDRPALLAACARWVRGGRAAA
jgi:PAS domain S-box-containing protein